MSTESHHLSDRPINPIYEMMPTVETGLTAEDLRGLEDDREARSLELVRQQRRQDAVGRWESACPKDLKISDWHHPQLLPHREPIERVLMYQLGEKGIITSGPTGRGKSRAMWQLMRRLGVDEGNDVRYWTASDWFTTLQEQIRYGRDDARGWVETVASRKVVFIDDLGQEAVQLSRADWSSAWFFRFLDIRVGEKLPLFVTTNLRAEDMAARAGNLRGDPLLRRLLDLCEPVSFETPEERAQRATPRRR